jgi:hypothetical protein
MPDQKGFFTTLNESQFGQLVEFGSRLGGTATFISTTVSVFQTLFADSDTSKILNAINQLRQELDRRFDEWGDLIIEQTQIILNTANRNAMAEALAHSDAAISQLESFAQSNDSQALVAANTESVLGLQFFLNLNPTDPFFLPGIIKGGTTRIAVITAQNQLNLPGNIEQINQVIDELRSMIDIMKTSVDAAHTVVQINHVVRCPANPQLASSALPASDREVVIIDGFAHREGGENLERFEVTRPQGQNRCEQSPFVSRARNAATQARAEGVILELEALGVPRYEELLQSWKVFLPA